MLAKLTHAICVLLLLIDTDMTKTKTKNFKWAIHFDAAVTDNVIVLDEEIMLSLCLSIISFNNRCDKHRYSNVFFFIFFSQY